MKRVFCECAHEVEWQEWGGPGQEDAPTIGRYIWCKECGEERKIVILDHNDYWRDEGMELITREFYDFIAWRPGLAIGFDGVNGLCAALDKIGAKYYRYGDTVFARPDDVRQARGKSNG